MHVRWVGHRLRMKHVTDKDGFGLFNADGTPVLEVNQEYELQREIPIIGLTRRVLDPRDFPGLSQQYVFGPDAGSFTVEMPEEDWTIVQQGWVGNDVPYPIPFKVVGDDDDGGRFETADYATRELAVR
jgi:hypothetical protein